MTHTDTAQLITTHLEPYLAEHGFYLVDVKVAAGKRIEVMADSDEGINIRDCVLIARYLQALPELELVFETHELEVSSPGVDEPLKLYRQYLKNVGRKVAVTLNDGQKLEGDLQQVHEDKVLLQTYIQVKNIRKDVKNIEIPFENIKHTVVQVKFN